MSDLEGCSGASAGTVRILGRPPRLVNGVMPTLTISRGGLRTGLVLTAQQGDQNATVQRIGQTSRRFHDPMI